MSKKTLYKSQWECLLVLEFPNYAQCIRILQHCNTHAQHRLNALKQIKKVCCYSRVHPCRENQGDMEPINTIWEKGGMDFVVWLQLSGLPTAKTFRRLRPTSPSLTCGIFPIFVYTDYFLTNRDFYDRPFLCKMMFIIKFHF